MSRTDPRDSIDREPTPSFTESMDLVMRYQQGEEVALDELLARYQNRIRRIVRIKLGSRLREHIESMDIVQEANQVVMRKLSDLELRDSSSIIQWLSKIVLNKVYAASDYFSAGKRDVSLQISMTRAMTSRESPDEMEVSSGSPPPEEEAARDELRELLDEGMSRLSEEHREVILQRDYYGASWNDITTELGRSSDAATQELYRRAWIKLRRLLRPKMRGLE